ncbi:MAG: hypothetical protein AB8G22_15940 [Saprospiraceae bacterium]
MSKVSIQCITPLIGGLYLMIQLFSSIYICFTPTKFFFWAPHTTQVSYQLSAEVNGKDLSNRALIQRYNLRKKGWEAHAIENVKQQIIFHEQYIGFNDSVNLTLTYSVNGKAPQKWHYPQ